MTALQSSILSQMMIRLLKVLCSTSIWHEVFNNYLSCCLIMNVSITTSVSTISTMTATLTLSYSTPTIILLPCNYDVPANLTAQLRPTSGFSLLLHPKEEY
jgi:hypothetical protein